MPYNLLGVDSISLSDQVGKSLSVDEVWAAGPSLPVAYHIGTSIYVIRQD